MLDRFPTQPVAKLGFNSLDSPDAAGGTLDRLNLDAILSHDVEKVMRKELQDRIDHVEEQLQDRIRHVEQNLHEHTVKHDILDHWKHDIVLSET